jgi:U3 small nucleolar RNA-associated protein 13
MSDEEERIDDDGIDSPPSKQQEQANSSSQPFVLSKCWEIENAVTTLYTGGRVRVVGSKLFTCCQGDVKVLVPRNDDDSSSTLILSVRGKDSQNNDGDDYDDDQFDAEAVTTYAVSASTIVTCSHNSQLKQYRLVNSTMSDNNDTTSPSVAVELVESWGKSGHTLPVGHMEFHASGVFLATGSIDGSMRIFDVRGKYTTHVYQSSLRGQSASLSAVTGLGWHPDMQQLIVAVARDDGSVHVHDLRKTDTTAVAILTDHVSSVTSLQWDISQNLFFTTGRDTVINVWHVDEKHSRYRRLFTLPVYEQIEAMVLVADATVATAGNKGVLKVWKWKNDKLSLHTEQTSHVFGEERGGYLQLLKNEEELIVADAEHNISFVDLHAFQQTKSIVGHYDEILDLRIIPKTDSIVVATNSTQVRILNRKNAFSCDAILDRHTGTVLCVDVSPCGRYIATCGKDKQARIWRNDCSVAVAIGHTEAIGSVALSRKTSKYEVVGKAANNGGGAFVATVSIDRTLKRWNLPGAIDLDAAATEQREIDLKAFVSTRAHEKDINIVAVAPNDSLIATGSQDKTIKLWNSTNLSLVATLKGHRRGVWDCQFSPFDRVLASGSGDKTVKLWSLSDFSCVRTFQGHVASVLRVRYLSGGLQLITSGADGLIKLWTVRTNDTEATMDAHDDKVWALDINVNGKEIVSGGADSKIIVWKDTTKEVADAKKAEEEESILMDQKLSNHLRRKEFAEALHISLERDKPLHTLKVLNAIIESDLEKGQDGLTSLKSNAKNWTPDQLVRILRYCRDWNTRARNSHVAMLTVKAIVSTVPAYSLAAMEGLPEILAGISPYAERHFERLDCLHSSSYIIDFALSSMGIMEDFCKDDDVYSTWESKSKLVLPPKSIESRRGGRENLLIRRSGESNTSDLDSDNDEVISVGESDFSD